MELDSLLNIFFQSLCLFGPILAANQGPGLARKLELPLGKTPVSRRWLGENKTLAAYWAGPLLGIAVVVLVYRQPSWWAEGLACGLGAVLGDHVKSFIKRRLGKPPGSPWFLDRIDFAVGGGVAAWITTSWVSVEHILMLAVIAWPVHYVGNRISYERGWRDTPH